MSRSVVVPFGLGLSLIISLAACKAPPEASVAEGPRAIKITEAGLAPDRIFLFTGTIQPFQDVEASFEVSGRIIEMAVEQGMVVKKGAVLARLDDRDFVAAEGAAKATFARAKADKERADLLIKDKAISQADYDRTVNTFEVARTDLDRATKAVEDTVLRAPFDGRVARKLISDLRTIRASEPIFRVHDLSRLKVDVDLPETLVARASDADLMRLRESITAQVAITAAPENSFQAKVHEIATVADPSTRTFRATLVMTTPEKLNVLPGMTVVVEATHDDEPDTTVPAISVRGDSGAETFVWVVDTGHTVSRRPVTAGEARGDRVVILDGLKSGEWVAASGFADLQEGMRVKPFTVGDDS